MNFNSTFEELSKLYESVPTEEPLTEGKIIDGIKKVGTRLGADVATIVRCFAELSGIDALEDLATYVEDKAVLKALQSGNETVLNTLTKEDIDELKQDIEEYEKAKKADKSIEEDIETEDTEEVDIEIEEDEQADDEAGTKVVLECSKCGGILLKDGADVSPDEENPALVNVGEACNYCESEEGFEVLGDFIPVEAKEGDLEEGIFGFGNKKKNTNTSDKSGKYDAAEAKALEKTPVVVKLWRDKSHKPEIVDYFDSNMAAEAVVKRHAVDTDKSIVYRYMTAKEAEAEGALVSLPSKYINKYLEA